MTSRISFALLTATVVLASCSAGSDEASTTTTPTDPAPSTAAPADDEATTEAGAPAEAVVTIEASRFDVSELRVAPGTTVTFVNNDPYAHTVTSTDDSPTEFDSGEFRDGETFEITFDEAGEYPYFCQIHPTMRAVVIVG